MASSSQISIACSSDERPKEPDALKEQAIALGHPREAVGQSSFFGSERDPPIYLPNLFVPDSQTGYHKGYENFHGDLDDFPLYGHNEELNSKTPGMYNHYASPGFHNGYGYNKQMSCGSYNPAATSLFGEPNFFVTVDHRADPVFQRSQLDGTSSLCSPGRGNYPGKPVGLDFLDQQRVCEGSRSSSIWSDWPKPLDGHHPFSLASQQSRFSSLGSCSLSYMDKAHAHELDQVGIAGNAGYKFGSNVGSCPGLNYGRHFGLGNGSVCSCSSANEIFNEHNRGPRSSKAKRQMLPESYLWIDSNRHIPSSGKIRNASYNKPDLIIEDAKFFVIKSYSEDNIHKSIKYGVWASTPHGNQKLNSAYQEAKEKPNNCSIFLLFSVNASAQFCGVAEMVGPVDFEKSVDYWQQDKWSGQFPVKWHIIKDVPNSQFRHIVLENNDNKPVTNSRDTQEVKLEQGVEMLNIFKNYETNISILDDFDFYEDRQKALQERKSKEHLSMPVTVMDAGTEKRNLGMESNELIEKMSKSFAQVVRLKECSKNSITAARS